jgi:hypothetical protein
MLFSRTSSTSNMSILLRYVDSRSPKEPSYFSVPTNGHLRSHSSKMCQPFSTVVAATTVPELVCNTSTTIVPPSISSWGLRTDSKKKRSTNLLWEDLEETTDLVRLYLMTKDMRYGERH